MRIVIDLQGAQSDASREKGIGRFSLSLAQAIARNKGEHEIIIALNGLFPDTVEPIRETFRGMLPKDSIRVWHAMGPISYEEKGHTVLRRTAEHVREGFLAALHPDLVYVPSMFEGLRDNAVTSIGQFTQAFPTAVTLFDLIPAERRQECLATEASASWYASKTGYLRRADLWLAISGDARHQGMEQLGLPQDKVRDLAVAGKRPTAITVASFADDKRSEYCPDEESFWDETARLAIAAFRECHASRTATKGERVLARRPKLAYVSPLPPERSGIADYSAEILPDLARHYEIDVIVKQGSVSDVWVHANCAIRDAAWLLSHAHEYDRVLYHFGNSPFHQHMFDLLERVPGVVVLHDFYLGEMVSYIDCAGFAPGKWVNELYSSFGYLPVQERARIRTHEDTVAVSANYPCNQSVINQALGVISHSRHSRDLAQGFYGASIADHWNVVPLPRAHQVSASRESARAELKLADEDFVVCSFGLLGPKKCNHRLLDAWLSSSLSKDKHCRLVFVGENNAQGYGAELIEKINASGLSDRIIITGWADSATYHRYLGAADMAVQLRTMSRGETSAAVLDCFNYGLPTIVNANGAFAELDSDAVWMLPDEFDDIGLQRALETLREDEHKRSELGKKGREVLLTRHATRICADAYARSIEDYYAKSLSNTSQLVKKIVSLEGVPAEDGFLQPLARVLAKNSVAKSSKRQLLIDISAIVQHDLRTGIQRVVRSLLSELIKAPPAGYRIEPVYLTDKGGYWHFLYARRYTLGLLDCAQDWLEDDHVEWRSGDVFLTLDLTTGMVVEAEKAGVYRDMKLAGLDIWFVVYDLLPVLSPEKFPPEASAGFRNWLMSVCRLADGVACISHAVADEMKEFMREAEVARSRPFEPQWFHLGADVESSVPTLGLPKDAPEVLDAIASRPTFLMVGTLEPRKGHTQTLRAFDLLWKQDVDVNLVIVGKKGWMMDELADALRQDEMLDKKLFWLEGISDEYLEELYKASTCLLAASEGEGFGLPLIEAAQHKIAIVARDIPVFREVAGEHAYYFAGLAPEDLASALQQWLGLQAASKAPGSGAMPWLTWKQSARQLLELVLNGGPGVAKAEETWTEMPAQAEAAVRPEKEPEEAAATFADLEETVLVTTSTVPEQRLRSAARKPEHKRKNKRRNNYLS